MYNRAAGRFNLLRRIRPLTDKTSAEKIYKAMMIQPVFTNWVSVGHVTVRVKLKALNVEERKLLVEIISSRQWRI